MARKRSTPLSQEGNSGKKESKGVAADDDLTIAALKDGGIRNLAHGKSKGNKSAAKTKKSERRLDMVSGKEHAEIISSKSKSNREDSTSKKIKYGGGVKIVEREEGVKADAGEKKNEEHMKTPMKRKRGADGDIVQTYLSSLERNSSWLRPRKEVLAFRMVNLDEKDNDRIVGKRIKVYWSGSRRWFIGRIRGFDDKKRLHRILYEDGDKEEIDLRKERFELEIMPTEGFNVRTETYSVKKKVGALDGAKLRADILKEESGEVSDTEKVTRSSEPKKENSSKKAGKRGSLKSRWKKTKIKKAEDSIAKNDVDVLPEEGDQLMTDTVCDSAFGEAHSEEEHVEVKEMGSYNSDSEKTETDDSIVIAKLAKRNASSKKKAMPAKVRSSKSCTRKESSQGKKHDADMEVDVHHYEFKKSVDGNVNIEEAVEVSDQNELNKTKALAIEASQKNGEVSCEAQATQPDLSAEKNKISLLDGKGSGDSGNEAETQKGMENIVTSEDIMGSLSSNLCGVENNVDDVAAYVEVAVDTAIVKEELMSRELNVQVPGNVDAVKSNDETVKRNDETDSVLIAEAEGMGSLSSNLGGVENNVEDAAAYVEVAVDTAIAKEELMSRELNVQVPGNVDTVKSNDETVKRNDETDSVLIAEAEGSYEVSVDLQPTILKVPEEENPEILHEKLKTENIKSQYYLSKEENLTSQKAEEARKTKSDDYAES